MVGMDHSPVRAEGGKGEKGGCAMFEAMIMLCAGLAGSPCRETLLPGYETPTAAACAEAIDREPPDIARFSPLQAASPPYCAEQGQPLLLREIASGVFVHEAPIALPAPANGGDTANLGVVIGEAHVAVIDTGGARGVGEALWRAIRQLTDKPVTHVILTHVHPDHVFGTGPFEETGAEIIGHPALPRALADRAANYRESLDRLLGPDTALGTRAPSITATVPPEGLMLDLGGRVLELRSWPAAHTASDLSVYDATSGTLFAGDLVFDRHVPALDGSLRGWQAALDELAALPVTRLLPGHGGPVLDWPGGAAPLMRYLDRLAKDTAEALAAGERLGEATGHIAQDEATHWQLFDEYNARNATAAFTELEWE